MPDKARIKIAAAVTALFLAGTFAAGLIVRNMALPPTSTIATPALVAPQPEAASRPHHYPPPHGDDGQD